MLTSTSLSDVRALIGRKSPEDIRAFADGRDDAVWLADVADRLQSAGFCTLNDVTDDEFDAIVTRTH